MTPLWVSQLTHEAQLHFHLVSAALCRIADVVNLCACDNGVRRKVPAVKKTRWFKVAEE